MTYDVYRYIFIGAAILCGIMFVVSVLLFILLKIPKVISDLTGATARKAIKSIREQNEASGDKAYKVSAFNEARGKLTDKISPSGNVVQQHREQMRGIDTTKIATQELSAEETANQTAVLDRYNETSVLGNASAGETSVLDNTGAGETSVLSAPASETAVLSALEPVDETADLAATETMGETAGLAAPPCDSTFCIEYEITFVHTNEFIA